MEHVQALCAAKVQHVSAAKPKLHGGALPRQRNSLFGRSTCTPPARYATSLAFSMPSCIRQSRRNCRGASTGPPLSRSRGRATAVAPSSRLPCARTRRGKRLDQQVVKPGADMCWDQVITGPYRSGSNGGGSAAPSARCKCRAQSRQRFEVTVSSPQLCAASAGPSQSSRALQKRRCCSLLPRSRNSLQTRT